MKTFVAKPDEVDKKWFVVSAAGKPLGRLSARIAAVLRGKHKPTFTPHVDCGDFVIVVDAEKVVLTGDKLRKKIYYRHSGYPGALKAINYEKFIAESPEKVILKAVRGMLPHNRLGRKLLTKLRVYKGSEHPHQAQKPELLEV